MSEKVSISKREYEYLLAVDAHMDELEARGVDNWVGYVGYYQSCDNCDADEITWAESKCPNCNEELNSDWYW